MGRNTKKWVDKKKDTTFSLVYRAAEDADETNAEERIMHPKGQRQYAAPNMRRVPGRRA